MGLSDFNLGGLRSRVQFRLQNDPRFTNSFVDLALKKAVTRLMLFIRNTTSIYTAETYILLDGDDAGKYAMEYLLPDNTLWVDSVTYDGNKPLKVMSQNELANTGIDKSETFGDPTGIYIYDTPERQKVAVLWPRPNKTATLEFWGGVEPDWTVNGDTSIPPFREEYSDALEAYARAYLIDGQEGEEARYDYLFKKWIFERDEAKFNQRVNRVSRTRRVRDI